MKSDVPRGGRLGAKDYPKTALAELYRQHWNIKLDFITTKRHKGLEMLRCETAKLVDKEIAVKLLAYSLALADLARAAPIASIP